VPQPSFSLLVERGLASIRERQREIDEALTEALTLVRQAGQQHADGNQRDAQATIKAAGDLLYEWLGDSDAIDDLETALRGDP
jgi:hypothetical protein